MIYTKQEMVVIPVLLAVVMLITLVVTLLLKNKSDKIKSLPFMIITIIMVVLEIIKQIVNIKRGFALWRLPFHNCSLFMIYFALASFGKGKLKTIGYSLSFANVIVFLIAFLYEPFMIIGSTPILDENFFKSITFYYFHTVVYHYLLILFLFLQIALKRYEPKFTHIKYIIPIVTFFLLIILTVAKTTNINFVSFLYNHNSFVENIRLNAGDTIYVIIMLLSLNLANVLTLSFGALCVKGYKKIKKQTLEEKEVQNDNYRR